MFNKFKIKIKNKNELFALSILIILTIIFTIFYSHTKKKISNNYKELINNVYFKKTTNHFFDNIEPKFKKIRHQVEAGETFDNILSQYSVKKKEIQNIKDTISKKINLNKLNTNQKIYFTVDQSNNSIKKFIFQISNKERLYLTKNDQAEGFSQKILITKLNKKVIYQENIILQSLYKSAVDKKIPANIIIELARIYGFQVDFQRDIRKKDRLQIMYEAFIDENQKVIETGNILFANLILSGEDNSLYYFDDKKHAGHYDKNGKSIRKA